MVLQQKPCNPGLGSAPLPAMPRRRGRPRKPRPGSLATAAELRARLGPRLAEAVAANWQGCSLRDLRAETRCSAPIAEARQLGMYLVHTLFRLSMTRTGAVFGRDRTTVRHACRLMEDRRDRPQIDQSLMLIEPLWCAGPVISPERWPEKSHERAALREAPPGLREEDRLLVLLAEPEAYARREEGTVQVIVPRKAWPLCAASFRQRCWRIFCPPAPCAATRSGDCRVSGSRPKGTRPRFAGAKARMPSAASIERFRPCRAGRGRCTGEAQPSRRSVGCAGATGRRPLGIDAAGRAAGERLRRDIEMACLPPKITINWDRLVVDGQGLALASP